MTAADYVPVPPSLPKLRKAVQGCQGCALYQNATQAVFGEGDVSARLILVGEQPGNQEDLDGRPFVGPAGKLLDGILAEAGISRDDVYVTNIVKHFKWEPQGTRRLHKRPSAREVAACRPWFDAERAALSPGGIVCLGATAAQALLGRLFRITVQRGQIQPQLSGAWIIATWHPSAVLRVPDRTGRDRMRSELVADLKTAAENLKMN